MDTRPLDTIQRLLGDEAARPPGVVRLSLPSGAVEVRVDGYPLGAPVDTSVIDRLVASARPARFGRGTLTLVDPQVRDTWEVRADRLELGGPTWDATFASLLDDVREGLGMPASTALVARLHSLLVYGPGQFFAPHQDSEKHDDMVATLVLTLPSAHVGGELVVDDGEQLHHVHGSAHDIGATAFYCDRIHEVRPVRSGHRVSLTFDLLVRPPDTSPADGTGPEDVALAHHLREHLCQPGQSRLVVLLDHEYSRVSLEAGRLKGADVALVRRLRAVAERAGCEGVLAQAEVSEVRAAALPDWGDGARPGPVLNAAVTLTTWVRDGETVPAAVAVGRDEVCSPTSSLRLEPERVEHHGYTGNEGSTEERWYRRAALVLWSVERRFAVRAAADPAWALADLLRRAARQDEELDADVASMAPFWTEGSRGALPAVLQLATAIRSRPALEVLLRPYGLSCLSVSDAALVADVAEVHGPDWVALLDADRLDPGWIRSVLPALCRTLRRLDQAALADVLADRAAAWFIDRLPSGGPASPLLLGHAADLAPSLAAALPRLLSAASARRRRDLIERLRLQRPEAVLDLVVAALRHSPHMGAGGWSALAEVAEQGLEQRLACTPRRPDDWTVPADWECRCPGCGQARRFLSSATEQVLVRWGAGWSHHVAHQLRASGLPVQVDVLQTHPPGTVVLTKTAALHQDAARRRSSAEADLAWLRQRRAHPRSRATRGSVLTD